MTDLEKEMSVEAAHKAMADLEREMLDETKLHSIRFSDVLRLLQDNIPAESSMKLPSIDLSGQGKLELRLQFSDVLRLLRDNIPVDSSMTLTTPFAGEPLPSIDLSGQGKLELSLGLAELLIAHIREQDIQRMLERE
jgi:hypothetical protein